MSAKLRIEILKIIFILNLLIVADCQLKVYCEFGETYWNSCNNYGSGPLRFQLFENPNFNVTSLVDSSTYNFQSYFTNEEYMTDNEVVRYGKKGLEVKPSVKFVPIYQQNMPSNTQWYNTSIFNENSVVLLGYASTTCFSGFHVLCTSKAHLYLDQNCERKEIPVGMSDVNMVGTYNHHFCNTNPNDYWLGFVIPKEWGFIQDNLTLIKTSTEMIDEKAIMMVQNSKNYHIDFTYVDEVTSIVANSEERSSAVEISHGMESGIESQGGVKGLGETTVSLKYSFSYSESNSATWSKQLSNQNVYQKTFFAQLPPSSSLLLTCQLINIKETYRGRVCLKKHTSWYPRRGYDKTIISNQKELWMSKISELHLITNQLCISGEFDIVYAQVNSFNLK